MAYPNRLVRDGAPRCSSEVLVGDHRPGTSRRRFPYRVFSCHERCLEARAIAQSAMHRERECKLGASCLLARSHVSAVFTLSTARCDATKVTRMGTPELGSFQEHEQSTKGHHMGVEDKASNTFKDTKGKVKESTGKATDNEDLESEGKADQAEASVKDSRGEAQGRRRQREGRVQEVVHRISRDGIRRAAIAN